MFHIFAGDTYYPEGGIRDYRHSRSNLSDAIWDAARLDVDWWEILEEDETGQLVRREYKWQNDRRYQ